MLGVPVAGPGDVLGLSAVLSGLPYEVTAEVIERSEVKTIRKQDFLRFLERHTEASLHAAKSLSQEYKTAFLDARRSAFCNGILAFSEATASSSAISEFRRNDDAGGVCES